MQPEFIPNGDISFWTYQREESDSHPVGFLQLIDQGAKSFTLTIEDLEEILVEAKRSQSGPRYGREVECGQNFVVMSNQGQSCPESGAEPQGEGR
jgi:hypothetical protein